MSRVAAGRPSARLPQHPLPARVAVAATDEPPRSHGQGRCFDQGTVPAPTAGDRHSRDALRPSMQKADKNHYTVQAFLLHHRRPLADSTPCRWPAAPRRRAAGCPPLRCHRHRRPARGFGRGGPAGAGTTSAIPSVSQRGPKSSRNGEYTLRGRWTLGIRGKCRQNVSRSMSVLSAMRG